jgi:ABC-type branched-subunit amino acid transport system substrate-binding protein
MNISANGVKLIQQFEGLRLKAYQDAVGVWTIGYGHTGPDVTPGLVISQAQADALLARDLSRFEAGVTRLAAVPLNQNQFDALGDATLGMVTVYHYSESHDSDLNRQFVKDFYEYAAPHSRPDFGGCCTYDVFQALYKLVEAQNGKLDPDKTMAMLKGMKFESPRGPIMIDQNRDIVQNVYVREVRKVDGKLQNVEIDTIPMVDDHGNQVKAG